jgi:aspartyl-tRNA(Asn)/glutamyl-tRNA(Gln) amidotransferase subunit B
MCRLAPQTEGFFFWGVGVGCWRLDVGGWMLDAGYWKLDVCLLVLGLGLFLSFMSETIYETVIGLEVHAQLLTKTKLFCGDPIAYGAEPNTQVSPVTLAHPGTLPVMNRKAVEYAVRMGLACGSEIEKNNYFARKNYFYPDLPKGYQVSQHTTPVCAGGKIKIEVAGVEKWINLNRIHLEEDAGKSIHDLDPEYTCIDYNRAGTPLIEIVSEPDLRSGDEAFAYLTEVRKLVRYLEICDGNMEEGSLRCDANISVRKKGDEKLGTKVEIKNLNSIRNVKRSIEVESKRLIEILESGGIVKQETRSFDANKGTSFSTREKEDADDYRYFPEPDLSPFELSDQFIEQIRSTLPVLPGQRITKYTRELNLTDYDARIIAEDRSFSDYYDSLIGHTTNYKAAANWMLGPVKTAINEAGIEINDFVLLPETLASVIAMVDDGKISFTQASTKLFNHLVKTGETDAEAAAIKLNLVQESDAGSIGIIVDEVLNKFADKVVEYKKGKKGLLSLFVGEVMKRSKGKADPKLTNDILLERLKS